MMEFHPQQFRPPTQKMIIANAGSGKTWSLSSEFARWCLGNLSRTGRVDSDRILALTFTRKAAREILEAIVNRLVTAKKNPKSAEFKALGSPSKDHLDCVVKDIARNISRLQVTTIDGFVNRLVRAYGNDLGFPEGWRIGELGEVAEARLEALNRVLENADPELIKKLVQDGMPKSSVLSQLEDVLLGRADKDDSSILSEYRMVQLGKGPEAWRAGGSYRCIANEPLSQQEFLSLITKIENLTIPLNKDKSEKKDYKKVKSKLVDFLVGGDWPSFFDETIVKNLTDPEVPFDERKYSRAGPKDWILLLDQAKDHALATIEFEQRERLLLTASFLKSLDDACWEVQEERGVYTFADLVHRLVTRQDSHDQSWDWLQYRLDCQINDLALDEFQDTSLVQYRLLFRFMFEILNSPPEEYRNFFLVGDPKQSIYGWRGGAPELIHEVAQEFPQLVRESLAKSYRSSPVLMDFVNKTFDVLQDHAEAIDPEPVVPELPAPFPTTRWRTKAGSPVVPQASVRWRAGWEQDHDSAHSEKPGLVTVAIADEATGYRRTDLAQCVVERILDRRARRPEVEIAVLACTNPELAEVFLLCREHGIAASMEGRSSLLDAFCVQQILALFRLADYSGDSMAHYLITRGSFPEVMRSILPDLQMEPPERLLPEERRKIRRLIASSVRSLLVRRGADGLVADLREALLDRSPELSVVDRSRLCDLVQLARTFKDLALPRPVKFVEAITRQKLSKASSAQVRLMTIHGSKGLGFEEVILMGADRFPLQEEDRMAKFVGYTPNVAHGPQVVVPGVNKAIRERWFPAIHLAAAEKRVRDCIDCMSEAYVAMTRSVSALHCVFSPCGKTPPKKQKTLGGLLSRAYEALGDVWAEGELPPGAVWALGDQGEFTIHTTDSPEDQASTLTRTSTTTSKKKQELEVALLMKPKLTRTERRGLSSAATASQQDECSDWSAILESRPVEILDRGTVLHERFRLVEWADDVDPSVEQLRQARRTVERDLGRTITDATWAEANSAFSLAMNLTQIQDTFLPTAHGAAKEDLDVRNEFPVLTRDEQGRVVRGRLDRLVLRREGDDVVEAWVMDHKSGATTLDDSAFQTRIDHYTPQLEAYAKVVQERWGLSQAKVHCVLIFFERGQVLEVPRSAESS
ncbi:MAG: hypothetical protein CBB84_005865 [Phycisphaera sp. TMED24]|nr:MAG: hypothetical protein CBB84_005865 [Phycisphaera sp. TMED24]